MSAPIHTVRSSAVRVGPRTIAALAVASAFGVIAFAWPFFVTPGSTLGTSSVAPVIFGALLLLVLAVVLAQLSEGGLDSKALAMLGVLSALGAALRPLGAGTAGVETIFFLLVVSGRALGPGFGFSLGCTTLFASALISAFARAISLRMIDEMSLVASATSWPRVRSGAPPSLVIKTHLPLRVPRPYRLSGRNGSAIRARAPPLGRLTMVS